MLNRIALSALSLIVLPAFAQDPVVTDGDKYKVLLENERVRVLEYSDVAGEKTLQHHHPAFVLYALVPFKRKITLPDGKIIMREFKGGDVIYSDGQTHIGENVGETPTRVIMVEIKPSPTTGTAVK